MLATTTHSSCDLMTCDDCLNKFIWPQTGNMCDSFALNQQLKLQQLKQLFPNTNGFAVVCVQTHWTVAVAAVSLARRNT